MSGRGKVLKGAGAGTRVPLRAADPPVTATATPALRKAFLAADAILVPDTKAPTAGIHGAKVLSKLGIADAVAARLKIYPNGATAMHLSLINISEPPRPY